MNYTAITKTTSSIPSSEGEPIRYDLYVPSSANADSFPLILFLHGFKGFKDWGAFPDACEDLAYSGFAVLAMNFSLNGIGDNPTEFDRLDLFAGETFSQDLDDVGTVIEALKTGKINDNKVVFNTDEIGIIGHSRGGQTAICAAAEYPEICCLVSWAAVANYNDHWTEQMIRDWDEKGVTEIENSRTGQKMPVNREVYEDARKNADRVMAINRIKELNLPVCLIHGDDDEAVDPSNARKLYSACPSKEKELKIIPNTGHTFGVSHPFEAYTLPSNFEKVLEHTRGWFEYYMK